MLRSKVCIITGASSGLGKALALSLAKSQVKLALFARDEQALQLIVNDCQQLGAGCIAVVGDVTEPKDCAMLVERTLAQFNQIDYLINNAGISMWADFGSVSDLSIFEKLVAVNYLGAVYCTHYVLPHVRKAKGMIIAVSSIQGKFGVPFHTGYSAAKHALHGFLNALRVELRNSGVDVLVITPSWLQGTHLRKNALSGMSEQKRIFRHQHSTSGMTLESCCESIIAAIEQRKRELFLPKRIRFLALLHVLCPSFVDWYIARRVQQEI